jgi:hypothetical protein
MKKASKEAAWEQTSWIPEEFAVVGKVLKLKNADGIWDNGWIVQTAGQNRVAENMLPDYHSEIKGHRKATGDALPKQKKESQG